MLRGRSAESPSASRNRLTALFKPRSKSTNVSAAHSRRCSSSRVTSSPGCSSRSRSTSNDWSRSLTRTPCFRSSPDRGSTSKIPKRITSIDYTAAHRESRCANPFLREICVGTEKASAVHCPVRSRRPKCRAKTAGRDGMRLHGLVLASTLVFAAGIRDDIPKTWDDAEIARHEIPLANPLASPKHVPSDYYYRIPVRPIYKGYPVYAPGREPSGYMTWLEQQEPLIVWDDRGHAPPLVTEDDWIRAGELVFNAPTGTNTNIHGEDVRNPEWLRKTGAPVARDGTLPSFQYIVLRKGVVGLGNSSCAFCHTRVMPDGSVVKGAQSNFPTQRAVAFRWRANAAAAPNADAYAAQVRAFTKRLHAAPYL